MSCGSGRSGFECVKPFFDKVLISVVEVTAQSDSKEGSQIAVAIDEKRCVREIMFLGESMQKPTKLLLFLEANSLFRGGGQRTP